MSFSPFFVFYFLIQSVTTSKYDFLTSIDTLIPFIPEFIWIYHSLIPIFFITTVIMIERREVFFAAIFSVFAASVIMILFYVCFPAFYPRDGYTDASLSGLMVEITRQIDGSNNTFPSSHVTFSWLLTYFVCLSGYAHRHKWARPLYLVWAFLISVSTVVLKQHFIIDVFSGVVLATACYILAKNLVYERLLRTS